MALKKKLKKWCVIIIITLAIIGNKQDINVGLTSKPKVDEWLTKHVIIGFGFNHAMKVTHMIDSPLICSLLCCETESVTL